MPVRAVPNPHYALQVSMVRRPHTRGGGEGGQVVLVPKRWAQKRHFLVSFSLLKSLGSRQGARHA